MDGAIIYVAGNPDLYPVEYYDSESQSYRGAIPEFLSRFAQEYGYDLRYFQPGTEDCRAELSENQQVDLISGCGENDRYAHIAGEPVILFAGGEADTAYALFLAQVAPSQFQTDLREYAARTSQAEWTGALLGAVGEAPPVRVPVEAAAAAGLVIFLLLAGLVAALLGLRREKKRKTLCERIDPETGLAALGVLDAAFSDAMHDQSQKFYSLICIHLALGRVGQLWGYERAKELLDRGAQAVQRAAGPGDVLARSGEDLLILKRAGGPRQAAQWADDVLNQLRAWLPEGLRPQDAAAGVYPLSAEPDSFSHALFHARQCARTACQEGQNSRLCETHQCRACQERWKLLEDFPQAWKQNEFRLYIRCFVDTGSLHIVGGEMLSRWRHPDFGLLSPGRYLPLLEAAGQIEQLDFYGLEKACAFLQDLQNQHVQDFFISCNLACKTFCASDFVQRFVQVVQQYSFPRKLLVLEITGRPPTELFEAERLGQNIVAVRQHGARVIFDNFGANGSSFRDLQTYPADGLKLDKELVDNMQTEKGMLIVRALAETAHCMGLSVFAEGVENDRQADILRQLHCAAFQGFRVSLPLPEAEARRRIISGERSVKVWYHENEEKQHGE